LIFLSENLFKSNISCTLGLKNLGAPFFASRLNFNLSLKDSHSCIDKEYMDFGEGRSLR
jgi:hypothetical protein